MLVPLENKVDIVRVVGAGEIGAGGQRVQASSYENMMCSIVTTVNIIVLYI